MGAQATDEAMPPSPFADGTGFCSVCLYRTRLWVPADDERPAVWLCEEEDTDRPRKKVAPAEPSVDVTAAQIARAFDRGPMLGYWERPEDDPAPTLRQIQADAERAAVQERQRTLAEARALPEQLARALAAHRAVAAARAGDQWVPLGYAVRGRHERH
jgi:hypothetical protein